MNKNDFSPLNLIPLPLFAPNAPALYGQGLTDYEILVRLFQYLNEDRNQINSFTDLMNRVKGYLENLDEEVQQEVMDYLNEIYETGELGQMVEQILREHFAETNEFPKNTRLDCMRKWRVMYQSEDVTYSGSVDSEYYSFTQGATDFGYNDGTYEAFCCICGNDKSHFHYNNKAVIHIKNRETAADVITTAPLTLGHANGITYLDGYFYIVHSYYYNSPSSTQGNTNISRIAASQLFNGITSPNVETKTINVQNPNETGFSSISAYGDKLYVNMKYAVYELDWENGTATHLVTPPNAPPYLDYYFQDMCVTKDYIYFLTYRPSCIVRFNRYSNHIDWVYKLEHNMNGGMYKCGEPQGFKIYDTGLMYLMTTQHVQHAEVNQHDITQLFEQNLSTNLYQMTNPTANSIKGYENDRVIVHVNKDNYVINPSGDSGSPFATIDEAVWYVVNHPKYDSAIIRMLSDSWYFAYMATNKCIEILTPLSKTQDAGDYTNNKTIGGIGIEGGGCITLRNVNFRATLAGDNLHDSYHNRLLRVRRASVTVMNCSFASVSDIRIVGEENTDFRAMDFNQCFANYATESNWNGSTKAGFNAHTDHDYLTAYNCTVNAHGKVTPLDSSIIA